MSYNALIAVTTYNKLSMTKKTSEWFCDLGYDLLYIDDCSIDGTQEYISQIKVDAILKNKRRGLTDSWNRAYSYFKASEYTHLIICNNDLLIPKGAVEGMLSNHPLVVPVCNEQGAGYACKEQSIKKNRGGFTFDVNAEENVQATQDAIGSADAFIPVNCWTGFCMCLSRDILDWDMGGNLFDPKFINVGNDDDLAKRVPARLALGAYIFHFKGISFNGNIAARDDLTKLY